MKVLLELTKRDLLVFVRNKTAVFFSFLSVIIILGLYVLFLSDVQVKGIEDALGKVEGAKALVNAWVMSGLIAVSTVTIALGSLGRIVSDRENKLINDFLVSPIKRTAVFIAYVLSTLIITLVISTVLFAIAEIYIINSGGVLLSLSQILQVIGVISLCVISSSLLMLFMVSFLKSAHSFSIMSNLVGTLIGFITGAYVPMGLMPNAVQVISNVIPVSQGASLLRRIFLEQPMAHVFKDAPQAVIDDFSKMQGVDLYFGKYQLSSEFMVLFIIGSIILFTIINILRFRKMKNN